MQWSHFCVVRKQVGVCLLIKHEELYYSGGLVFDSQMQVCLSKLFQLLVNVPPACFLLHLEYFNELFWLVMLDELY
jgi:hypothetical protein